jgi:hypothetical protein
VAVGVQRHVDAGVAQPLLDNLSMNVLAQQQSRAGMAQVMEADLWNSGLLNHRQPETPQYVATTQRATARVAKDPGRMIALRQHAGPVGTQCINCKCRQGDAAARFLCFEPKLLQLSCDGSEGEAH